jgi:hypothetical protein
MYGQLLWPPEAGKGYGRGDDEESVSVYFMDTVQLPSQEAAALRHRIGRVAMTVIDRIRG